MSALRWLGVVAVVCGLGATAGAEDKPDYAKLIVGRWEVAKAAPGTVPAGAVIEFTKGGRVTATATLDGKEVTVEGTYTLDGNTITATVPDRRDERITITTISEAEMSTTDEGGKEVTLKRKK